MSDGQGRRCARHERARARRSPWRRRRRPDALGPQTHVAAASGPSRARRLSAAAVLLAAVALSVPAVAAASAGARRGTAAAGHAVRRHAVRRVLAGDGIGPALFGESRAIVTHRIDTLLGCRPSRGYRSSHRGGGIDHEIRWQRLHAYFGRGRFVGYEYWGGPRTGREPALATRKGLLVGDTVSAARHLYGSAFTVTAEQGGAWFVRSSHGRLSGYTSEVRDPRGKILTIGAGRLGTEALTP